MHKGHITGRKNFNKKKSKFRVWHSFRKNTLNHTAGTQKSVFFQFRILRSVSVCSLYLLQTKQKFDQISVHPTVQWWLFASPRSFMYSCPLHRFAIRSRIESLRLPIQGFFFVACPWLHEQVIHSDEHLLGSGPDVNV